MGLNNFNPNCFDRNQIKAKPICAATSGAQKGARAWHDVAWDETAWPIYFFGRHDTKFLMGRIVPTHMPDCWPIVWYDMS